MFQSTPAYGGRRQQGKSFLTHFIVSIHARVWRATVSLMRLVAVIAAFQSTPAYGGRQVLPVITIVQDDVSIHARVWRAT